VQSVKLICVFMNYETDSNTPDYLNSGYILEAQTQNHQAEVHH